MRERKPLSQPLPIRASADQAGLPARTISPRILIAADTKPKPQAIFGLLSPLAAARPPEASAFARSRSLMAHYRAVLAAGPQNFGTRSGPPVRRRAWRI